MVVDVLGLLGGGGVAVDRFVEVGHRLFEEVGGGHVWVVLGAAAHHPRTVLLRLKQQVSRIVVLEQDQVFVHRRRLQACFDVEVLAGRRVAGLVAGVEALVVCLRADKDGWLVVLLLLLLVLDRQSLVLLLVLPETLEGGGLLRHAVGVVMRLAAVLLLEELGQVLGAEPSERRTPHAPLILRVRIA